MAHRTLSDVVSDEALRDLMAREVFAEGKVCTMDGVESGADVVFGDDGNGVLGGRVSSRE